MIASYSAAEDTTTSKQQEAPNPAFYHFLSEMANSIADEIRNPLAGIAGTVSILKDDLKEHLDDTKIKTIDSCIRRIDSFIEDLYLLTHPINPSFIKIQLVPFVEQVVKQYFYKNEIPYNLNTDENDSYIWADLILLQNAIANILDNAVDAVEGAGEISIVVARNNLINGNQKALITILDTGMGIEKKVLENLFTPFHTTKHNGRGLGLVIARNYIRLHGGDICVESEETVGTIAKLKLPVCTGSELCQ